MFFILSILFIYLISNTHEMVNNKNEISFLLLNKKYKYLDDINIFSFNNQTIFNDNNISSNTTMYFNGELIFVKYEMISFIILMCGLFIILYGAYYYILSLTIHFSLSIYYIIILLYNIIFNKEETDSELVDYLYFFLVSILTGILLTWIIKMKFSKKEFESKKIKIIYGGIFGFYLFKSIVGYYLSSINDNIAKLIYLFFLLVSIIIGGFLNLISFFGKHSFLPCSILSGSYYIINSISYILKEYYTDLKFMSKHIEDKNETSTIITYLVIQILLILGSFFHQIKHINYKLQEDPEYIERYFSVCSNQDTQDIQDNQENEDLTHLGTIQSNEQDETFKDESKNNENLQDNDDEDEYINDQED